MACNNTIMKYILFMVLIFFYNLLDFGAKIMDSLVLRKGDVMQILYFDR